MPANCIGISLGTRTIGIACFYNGRLSDSRVRTFWEAWNESKQSKIVEVMRKIVIRYDASVVAIKIPPAKKCSPNLQALLQAILDLKEVQGAPVLLITAEELKKRYSEKRSNKQIFIASLIQKYPHLGRIKEGKRGRTEYHDKLFEAIECGEYAIEMGL